jgi:hypothetical protein
MPVASWRDIKVADEVWIAAALLQTEQSTREDFEVEEIVERARKEGLAEKLRPGVYIHAQMHCVANRPPNPGRYRMLFETRPGFRRLFCPGDPFDPKREGSKTSPSASEIPERYRYLLRWYEEWCKARRFSSSRFEALIALEGSGKDLWKGEGADEYVNRLREGWE